MPISDTIQVAPLKEQNYEVLYDAADIDFLSQDKKRLIRFDPAKMSVDDVLEVLNQHADFIRSLEAAEIPSDSRFKATPCLNWQPLGASMKSLKSIHGNKVSHGGIYLHWPGARKAIYVFPYEQQTTN